MGSLAKTQALKTLTSRALAQETHFLKPNVHARDFPKGEQMS